MQPQEIIVSGERVSRSLHQTPSSVAVFTGDAIDALPGAERLEDILELVPNVQAAKGGQGPTIRGQDSTGVLQDLPAFLGGTRPRVTVQVDGRAVGYSEFVFGAAPLWDAAQVEVFRSPQTTTQGRNSIAGAIFIRTENPSYEWEAGARAIAGSLGLWHGSAVATGPLIDGQLAFRLSADARRSRTASELGDSHPGANPNRDRFALVRFKLLAEPNALPGLRLVTTYAHTRSKMPQIEGVRAPFRERRDPLVFYGVFSTNIDSLTAAASYRHSPTLLSQATISYGNSYIRRFPPPGIGETQMTGEDLSLEAIVNWRPDGPVKAIGGIHALRTKLDQEIDLSAIVGTGAFNDAQNSLGLFGEADLELAPRLTLTAGLRYQIDSQRRAGRLAGPVLVLPIDFDEAFDAWLPKVALRYDFTDSIAAGLLAQRGFNPGGTTLNFDTGEQEIFDAETLWSYEVFARARLAGGRAILATNAFYNAMRDAQRATTRSYTVPGGRTAFWAEIDNVPKAESYGFEASLTWQVGERLDVRGGIGLLKTRIIESAGVASAIEGNSFSRAPAFTGSAMVDWRPTDKLQLNASLRHNAAYFSDDANSPALRVGAATRVDARAAYDFGPATLFGYARNLLDDFYMTYLFSPTFGTAGDPRELGIGLEARF